MTVSRRTYEGMYLVDSSWAENNWQEAVDALTGLVSKHNGSVRRLEKWGDRKLAYPIRVERTVHRRGTYVLVAMELPPEAPAKIMHDVHLDVRFLRAIIQARRADQIDRIFDPFPAFEGYKRRRDGAEGEEDEEAAPGEHSRDATRDE